MISKLFSLAILLISATWAQQQQFTWRPEHARKYAKTPVDVTVDLGANIVLPCRTTEVEKHVQWTKNGFGMGFERDFRFWHHRRYRMIGNDECK